MEETQKENDKSKNEPIKETKEIQSLEVESKQEETKPKDSFLSRKVTPKMLFAIYALIIITILLTFTVVISIIILNSNSSAEPIIDPDPLPTYKEHDIYPLETEGFLGNPMKGYVVNFIENNITLPVPISLEYLRLKLSDIYPSEDKIDLDYLETKLDSASKRLHQVIVRLVLDVPGDSSTLPEWFKSKAKMFSYFYEEEEESISPDYNDEFVLQTLEKLFKELGQKFNGDHRIAVWQLGTYGHFGEWHTKYATNITDINKTETNEDYVIKEETLDKILEIAINNFNSTLLQIGKPQQRGKDKSIGLFHSYFSNEEEDNIYEHSLSILSMTDKYKTEIIGGEEDRKNQLKIFGEEELINRTEDNINKYHPSFLFDQYFYENYENITSSYSDWMLNRNTMERLMGYNFYITEGKIKIKENSLHSYFDVQFEINIKNKGVAPFYSPWPIHFAVVRIENDVVKIIKEDFDENHLISGILPGEVKLITYNMKEVHLLHPEYKNFYLAIRIPSPIGTFIKFANAEQREDGWMILFRNNII